MKTIQEIIKQDNQKQLSLEEILESFNHIHLTKDEAMEAMILAKQKKERVMQAEALRQREEDNRLHMTSQWSYTQTRQYMTKRAESLFNGAFKIDDSNQQPFHLLCLYFSEDPKFVLEATAAGITGASLSKGVMIAGNYGTGKTWLLKLFCRNRRQVFHIHSAKDIAESFVKNGEMDEFVVPVKNALDDKTSFYHEYSGLCIDDMGAEGLKNHYGNKKNVVGDLIEHRYNNRAIGKMLHATTNLNAEGLKEFYGERVTSRFKEIFNIIVMNGNDRRK